MQVVAGYMYFDTVTAAHNDFLRAEGKPPYVLAVAVRQGF